MNNVEEMPATLLRQEGEFPVDQERSRAALWGVGEGLPHAQTVEPLDDGVVSIHEAVVLILRRL